MSSKKSRGEKALWNTIAGFSNELVTLVCGLVLPRLILTHFGSSYNGIVTSISSFISCIALMKAGIGGVAQAALYKPLADNDTFLVSAIANQVQRFMRKVALIFIFFVIAFAGVYSIWINDEFDWLFSASLIVIISFSTFAQYYFGMTSQTVLNADQCQRVVSITHAVSYIVNTLLSVLLLELGASIHIVKLGSSIVFCFSPYFLYKYVNKKYKIDTKAEVQYDLVKQRWDAVGHEVANFINTNTDVMILTVFTTLNQVSVYTVYHSVIIGIRKVVTNLITGFGAAFGNMHAKREQELMAKNLKVYELIVFSAVSILYPVVLVMITPFVLLYTRGVTDTSYYQPIFGAVLVFGGAFSCYRIPYETIVKAIGHYKQTRNAAFIEAIINLVTSIVFVKFFGLVGVAIGTLLAAIFRTIQYAMYLSAHIIKRSMWNALGHMILSLVICCVVYIMSLQYLTVMTTVTGWIYMAVITTMISIAITVITDFLFYNTETKMLVNKLAAVIKRLTR